MGVLSLIRALCLGSSAGLLAVSMPIAVPLVPIMAFSIEWDPLLSSSTNSLLAAALSMDLAGLTWHRKRRACLAETGPTLGMAWCQLPRTGVVH